MSADRPREEILKSHNEVTEVGSSLGKLTRTFVFAIFTMAYFEF